MIPALYRFDLSSLSFPKKSMHITGHRPVTHAAKGVRLEEGRILSLQLNTLIQLYALSHERKPIGNTSAWQAINTNLSWLKEELLYADKRIVKQLKPLVNSLNSLIKTIPADLMISVSVSYGECTPWNMYCDERRSLVFGWETARNGIPVLFDVFHHLYVSAISETGEAWPSVEKALAELENESLLKQLQQKYRVNLTLHHRLYLLFTVSAGLRTIMMKSWRNETDARLLRLWNDAFRQHLGRTVRSRKN